MANIVAPYEFVSGDKLEAGEFSANFAAFTNGLTAGLYDVAFSSMNVQNYAAEASMSVATMTVGANIVGAISRIDLLGDVGLNTTATGYIGGKDGTPKTYNIGVLMPFSGSVVGYGWDFGEGSIPPPMYTIPVPYFEIRASGSTLFRTTSAPTFPTLLYSVFTRGIYSFGSGQRLGVYLPGFSSGTVAIGTHRFTVDVVYDS